MRACICFPRRLCVLELLVEHLEAGWNPGNMPLAFFVSNFTWSTNVDHIFSFRPSRPWESSPAGIAKLLGNPADAAASNENTGSNVAVNCSSQQGNMHVWFRSTTKPIDSMALQNPQQMMPVSASQNVSEPKLMGCGSSNNAKQNKLYNVARTSLN